MVYMWVTDYVVNTAGYVFQEIGKLTYNITDDMVPAESQFRLNTSSIGGLIPQLKKMYPNMLMELIINSTKAPNVTVGKDAVDGMLLGDVIAYVVLPNATRQYVFTLGVVAKGSGTVGFADPNITGKVTSMSADLTLTKTAIGPFSLILIQPAVDIFIDAGVIPYLNDKGKKGFPLPSIEGVEFINPEIVLKKNVIQVGTDLKYVP
ncbi:bactericidal permeability-increasing protein-like isoform X2 [Ptychodera flava]|uniref:bactericidal permeability-increasing protein-like isoform X2 n=1 Tax=Ptychodera flava TaxID=63121 RepID=UPI00396A30B6